MSSTVSWNLQVSVREDHFGSFGARFLECFEPTSVSVYG